MLAPGTVRSLEWYAWHVEVRRKGWKNMFVVILLVITLPLSL
jgi:hypothetical protein